MCYFFSLNLSPPISSKGLLCYEPKVALRVCSVTMDGKMFCVLYNIWYAAQHNNMHMPEQIPT